MPNVLITGANRGLGLTWTRQYAEEGWRVFATCRHPAEARDLQRLAERRPNINIHRLDITVTEDLRAIHWQLQDEPIDVLLNNAGVYLEKGRTAFGHLRYDEWRRTLEVNTFGAIRVTEALWENVAQSDKRLVVIVTSRMGSIGDIKSGGSYYYRSSKAALNAATRGLAAELEPRGIGVLLIHPGGVMTRMGPVEGLTTEESVRGMRALVERFSMTDSGRFFSYDGSELPW